MTETCSGSAKPEKAPAELGTDKAELARESSELFVKCKRGTRREDKNTETDKQWKGSSYSGRCNGSNNTNIWLLHR